MKGTPGAMAYLIVQTTRNRVRSQLARVKNPRYALALVAGALYIWFFFFAQQSRSARAQGVTSFGATPSNIAALALAATAIAWWLFAKLTSALAFQPAEVQLLFPAPISRRGLIAYKIVRLQLVVLLNAIVWTLLLRRFGVGIPGPLRFLTAWGLFSVLSLHRLGVALVKAPPLSTNRRIIVNIGRLLAVAAAAAIIAGVAPSVQLMQTLPLKAAFESITAALTVPPASIALAPFRALMAPLYAPTTAAWLGGFAIVVGLVAVHVIWVLAMNVEFEEVAATASTKLATQRAAMKARRSGTGTIVNAGTKARDWLPLRPLGLPAVAITWKNTLAVTRTGLLKGALILVVMIVIFSQAMSHSASEESANMIAVPFAVFAFMMFFIGPRALRNDLRQDLLHLAALKTYPLSGTAIVAAEMASPTLLLAGMQVVLLIIAYFVLPATTRAGVGIGATAMFALLVPVALVILNAVGVGLQNGAALLFPAWVRLGPDSGGIEAIGQNLLLTLGSMLALLLTLLVPVGVGVIASVLARSVLGGSLAIASAAGIFVCTALLAVELAMLVRALGAAFDRIDPTAIAA